MAKKTAKTAEQTTLEQDAKELLEATAPGVVTPVSEPLPLAEQQQQQVDQNTPENIALSKPPVKKFYEAQNSNRIIKSNGLEFSFSPYAHVGGTWMGTFATDVPEQIEALDKLLATGKSAIYSLTEEQYANCLKKKAVTLQGLGESLIHSEAQSQPSRSANPADQLNTEPNPPAPAAPPVESVADIAVGESKMPEAANP